MELIEEVKQLREAVSGLATDVADLKQMLQTTNSKLNEAIDEFSADVHRGGCGAAAMGALFIAAFVMLCIIMF